MIKDQPTGDANSMIATILFTDSTAAIYLVVNTQVSERNKNIDIKQQHIWNLVRLQTVKSQSKNCSLV